MYKENNPSEIKNVLKVSPELWGVSSYETAKYYYSYMDEGSTWSLMNDGLGDTVTDTTALQSGTLGNIRYFGKTPDNYIYFNCDDYNNQTETTCEKMENNRGI